MTRKFLRWNRCCAFILTLAGVELASVNAEAGAKYAILPAPMVTIYPGETIVDGMLGPQRISTRRIGRLPVVRRPTDAIGKVTRRTLLPGRPILKSSLHEPAIVKRGQPSSVVFRSGGLVVNTTAVALNSGSVGDLISLRNAEGGRVIRGVIQPDGTVLVGVQ